jgi:hypothetical protein
MEKPEVKKKKKATVTREKSTRGSLDWSRQKNLQTQSMSFGIVWSAHKREKSLMWWPTPVVPAAQEAEVGELLEPRSLDQVEQQ